MKLLWGSLLISAIASASFLNNPAIAIKNKSNLKKVDTDLVSSNPKESDRTDDVINEFDTLVHTTNTMVILY